MTVHPVISLDATLGVREAVRQGAGLSVLPDFAVADDLKNGTLIQVLPRWSLPSGHSCRIPDGTLSACQGESLCGPDAGAHPPRT